MSTDISPLLELNMFYIILRILYIFTFPLVTFSGFISVLLLLCVTGTFDALTNQTKHIHFHFIILDNYIQ
jgi:hypothetical protein